MVAELTPLLRVNGLFAGYGPVEVVKGASLNVDHGEIVTIIGPNGAGKSTFIKGIYGMADVTGGTVEISGEQVAGMKTEQLLRRGMALVLQGRCNFPEMTVVENLDMGAFTVPPNEVEERKERVFALLPLLKERAKAKAGQLSGGQQQLLEIGMMLMVKPRLLILDEPTLGLDPRNVELVFEYIVDLARSGLGVLMVEQNARQALEVSDRGCVLVDGQTRIESRADQLLDDPAVAALYLGT